MCNFHIILLPLIFQTISVTSTDSTDFPLISTTTTGNTTTKECDRLEYTYWRGTSRQYLKIIPAGVCLRSSFGSEMLVCDDSSTMREFIWYNSDECQGEVSYSIPAAQRVVPYYDNVSISITCCTGNQCPYVDVVVHDFDDIGNCSNSDDLDINDGDVSWGFSDGPYVIGSCEFIHYNSVTSDRSTLYQCSDGKFIKYEYEDNLECQGTVDDTEETSTGDCHVYSKTKIQISEVICETAIDTCGIYGPTTTTATTASSSEITSPSATTIDTADLSLISTTTVDATITTGCDRLEYTYSSDGDTYLRIIPAGVCLRSIIGSDMYVCDDSSTMRELSWHDNDECQGEISYSESVEESLEYYDDVSISITCCTGNQCPFVDVVVYDFDGVSDCTNSDDLDIKDGEVNYVSSAEGPYVIDSCEYINYDWLKLSTTYQCLDGKFLEHEYKDNLQCEGTIDDTEEISSGDCYAYSSTTKIQISQVTFGKAIDTCGNYVSSAIILAPVYIIYGIIIGLVMFV